MSTILHAPATLDNISGKVLRPGDIGYDDARKIWNGMFDHKPSVIVQCANTEDVIAAVEHARENALLLAVKGGGHNSAGTGCCDGGLMLDLSLMRKISVDRNARTVSVEGGCLWSEVDQATQKFGWAVPAGIISHTGVGGLTLGGGFGWISRKHGLSVDNLVKAQVVTARGEVVYASEDENPDLFWGLRGGGGNFGVVTEFTFRCAEIGTEVYSGAVVKAFDDMKDYVRFHREYVRTMPDEMTIWMVVRHAPPVPFIPAEMHGKLVVLVPFCYLGDAAEGERLMDPIRRKGITIGDGSGIHPYVGWQSAFDGLVTHGARNYWKSHHLKSLSDECIDVLMNHARKIPHPDCEIFIPHMEGAPSRVPPEATAFSHRSTPFVLNIHGRWQDPADDTRCLEWTRALYKATESFSQGVYVNFLGNEGADRVKQAYTPATWQKLVAVKRKWDPNNLFRVNQNIDPA
jgi:FAD/FMN-containing dehydrogenase